MSNKTVIQFHNIREFRAAQTVVDRKERREFIRGLYLEFNDEDTISVTATNGHRLLTYDEPYTLISGELPDNPVLVTLPAIISANAQHIELELDHDSNRGTATVARTRDSDSFVTEQFWNPEFPEYRKITKKARYAPDREPTVSRIGFDALYLADIQKALKATNVELRFANDKDYIDVHFYNSNAYLPSLQVVLMPCRV